MEDGSERSREGVIVGRRLLVYDGVMVVPWPSTAAASTD